MLESVGSVRRSQSPTSPQSSSGTDYKVQRGDTLGEIAARFGTDVNTLARLNNISNPNRIMAGQTIEIPVGGKTQTVQRGDTLTKIAAQNNTTVDALMKANPQIRNANQIYPGDAVRIPVGGKGNSAAANAGSRPAAQVVNTQAVEGVANTSIKGSRLSLSQTDINNIKKTLQTEWVQSAGDDQAKGIVDTILNRTASGHWGTTVANVVNAKNQFSDINGPPARKKGRDSVEKYPMSKVSKRVDAFVDSYLAQRAAGTPSSVGTHLNYANPHYSDAKNLPWIMALNGPVFGKGDSIHRHGTTPGLEKYRPEAFSIALPGSASGQGASSTQRVDNDGAQVSNSQFVNPTGGGLRNDSGGHGHYGASRRRANGPGVHHGIDILSTPGQSVRAPISGTLRQVNPNNIHQGFEIVSPDGRQSVRVFYAAPDGSLIGQRVQAGDDVATAQDLQMRGSRYGANVRDHVHVEIRINQNRVDPAPYFFR